VLVWSAECPKGDGTTAKLCEPALELRLRGIVGKTAHVKDLATLRKEGTDIGPGVHGLGEHIGVLKLGLRLADEATEHSCKGNGLFHSPPWRGGGESLQVEGQVVLDGGRRLYGLDLEGSADVGQGAGTKRQRLWVVGLPALVLGAQIECARVLEVGGQDNGLVAGLAGQLDTQVPRVEGDKGELVVVGNNVFLGEAVEAVDGVAERAGIADLVPGEGG
jgi:hypothetical protein